MLRAWLAWWIVSAALWLALVDNQPLPELIAGAVVATLAATAAVLVRRWDRPFRLRLPPGAPARALRQLAGLAGDVPALLRVLWWRGVLRRPGHGALVEVPFAAVEPRAPRDAADRVMAQALGSLAPATIAIELDDERRVLVEHRLERTEP
jgi:hypothetical protein